MATRAIVPVGRLQVATPASMAAAVRGNTEATTAIDERIQAVAAAIVAADPTIKAAAATAIAQAIIDAHLVGTARITGSTVEMRADDGVVWMAVDGIYRDPHLRGSRSVSVELAGSDSGIEVRDRDGYVRFRSEGGGSGGGSFTETHFIPVMGQSNAVGALASPLLTGTNDPLPNLFMVPQKGAGAGTLVPATDPMPHPVTPTYADTRGHGVRFGRLYALAHPNVRVVLVPVAESSTSFRGQSRSWAPAREGDAGVFSLYRDAIDRITAAMALVSGVKRVGAFLWHQGESDASRNTTGAQYQSDLDDLILGVRSEVPGAVDAPFIIGGLAYEYVHDLTPGTVVAIDAVHRATPTRVRRTAFAESPPAGHVNTDQIHFLASGQWLLAASMWAAYDRALYNNI